MLPTGRTENLNIKVKPDIKNIIAQKKNNESFNLSEWFEDKFMSNFMPSKEKLEAEKKLHLDLAAGCDKMIEDLTNKKKEEDKLILSPKELRHLYIACDPKDRIKRQWGLFTTVTKKKLTMKEFIKIKEKYMGKSG